MEIRHRQQAFQARFQPLSALERLALGTMPVAARIVRDAPEATAGAGVHVPAQSGRAASRQATQHGTLLCRQGMAGLVSLSMGAENVRHLQTRTQKDLLHLGLGLPLPSRRFPGQRRQTIQRTYHLLDACRADVRVTTGGVQRVMAEQGLDEDQVSAGVKQVRGEAVPQAVR